MQFNAICTECKEMFLFTEDLLWIRPMTKYNGKVRPLCFRCSTTVGSAVGARVSVQLIEDKDKPVLDLDDAIKKYGIERVAHIVEHHLRTKSIQEVLKEKIESSRESTRNNFDMR
jgi:hypothetical protein